MKRRPGFARPSGLERRGLEAASPSCCRQFLERHVLDFAERELEEALAERPEALRVARGQEAVAPLARAGLDALAGERLGHLARRLFRGEDERDVATEDPLENGADERIVGAAEDNRVAAGLLHRRGVLAYGLGRLGAER